MSLVLPVFYHWSSEEHRAGIVRRGLRPTCPTGVPVGVAMPGGGRVFDPDGVTYAVCLGTSPSHAWSLSGALWADPGSTWDLWQVSLDEGDEVHPLPFFGNRLEEVRVANRIPKSRVWFVASRVAAKRRWNAA